MKKWMLVFLMLAFSFNVYAADQTLPDKTADATPTTDDLVYTVNDPLGTPGDRKVTLDNFSKGLNASNMGSGTLAVNRGGTGAATLTDGGLLLGSGTSAVTALGVAANGQIPIGDGATDPVLATITAVANETDVTNAAGSITIGIVDPLIVGKGGIGAATLTNGGVLLGSGTSAVTPMGVLANGSIIVGDGATDPVALAAFTSSTGDLKHESGGIEADISAIADGGVLVGTGAGTMAIRASFMTAGAAGTIKHELGGLEAGVNAYDGLIGITGGATYNQTGTTTQIIIFDGAGAPTSAALSSDVTMDNAGAVTIADSVTVTGWTMGASVATTAGADDADTSLATTAWCQTTQDYLKTAELTAASIEAILTNNSIDFGTGAVAAVEFNLADGEYIEWGTDENLTFEATRTDFILSNDLIIEDVNPGIAIRCDDDNVIHGLHYHVNEQWPLIFYRGIDTGSGANITEILWAYDSSLIRYDYDGSAEIAGLVPTNQIKHLSWSVDPGSWYDSDAEIFLIEIGDDAPNGIIIDEWKTSCQINNPSPEVSATLHYADAWISLANAVTIDTLTTTSGTSSEDTDVNINGGAAIPNGKVMYILFTSDPEGTATQWHGDIWYHII